ncbi:MAG: MaoC/PaaZ C-terminal domain-containing protein [Acidimicrobiales bacterium]
MPIEDGQFVEIHGPVTSELLVRLATLLNDFNPAHYDLEFATSVGLPGVIGPGTLLQAWIHSDLAARVADGVLAGGALVRELDLRFRSPFLVGETVQIAYTVAGTDVQIAISAGRDGDEPRSVATATARLIADQAAAAK